MLKDLDSSQYPKNLRFECSDFLMFAYDSFKRANDVSEGEITLSVEDPITQDGSM